MHWDLLKAVPLDNPLFGLLRHRRFGRVTLETGTRTTGLRSGFALHVVGIILGVHGRFILTYPLVRRTIVANAGYEPSVRY